MGDRRGSTSSRSRRGCRRTSTVPRGPFTFDLIAGGHSNLTFGVTDADGSHCVLRRPPLGHVLATAHDMGREHRIISALAPTDVPVPPALGLCTDDDGQRRAVLRHGLRRRPRRARPAHGRGRARRGRAPPGQRVDRRRARRASTPSTSTPSGLGDLGKHEGYIARQLKRWYSQFQASNELTGRPVPAIHEVHDRFSAAHPRAAGRRRSSTATTASTTAWSATTATSSPSSTGRSAPSATRSPTSASSLVYWTDADRRRRRPARRAHPRSRASPPRPS